MTLILADKDSYTEKWSVPSLCNNMSISECAVPTMPATQVNYYRFTGTGALTNAVTNATSTSGEGSEGREFRIPALCKFHSPTSYNH